MPLPAENALRPEQQYEREQSVCRSERQARIDQPATAVSADRESSDATIAPRTSPTPPMITMISAFIVKTTPIDALKVRKCRAARRRRG